MEIAEAGAPAMARRAPAQQRSRDRLERFLAVATALIAEKGSDHLKMSEVAERAGASIGSLYQYFPDKAAIIRALAERIHATSNRCIADALTPVRTIGELQQAFAALVDQYYGMFLSEPVMRDISSGMQADKELMAIELAANRANAETLADAMRRVRGETASGDVSASALLIWQLGEATMRLAISVDRREGDALVEAYKRMMARELAAV